MPLRVRPLKKTFHLAKLDQMYENEGAPTVVTVRQSTVQDAQNIEWDGTTHYQFLFAEEVYSTLCDCNLLDADDKPVFRFKGGNLDMTKAQFMKAWQSLPQEISLAIHGAVLELNPQWGDNNAEEGDLVEQVGEA